MSRPAKYLALARSLVLASTLTASSGAATEPAARDAGFAGVVQPLLAQHCYSCHGAEKQKGGLRLDRRAEAFTGGDGGKVIIPGHSGESRLIKLIAGLDPETVMPPKGERLTSAQVEVIRQWIDAGAVWPEHQTGIAKPPASGSAHWAFVAPTRPIPPAPRNPRWGRNEIDTFILERLEKEGLVPSPEADRRTLIRRLSFDLLGLPPTPGEVEGFVLDREPGAYERLVDHLLDSPHYGERWGRHWLDLARYADSDGYEKDTVRPYAWHYRDWVIEALNRDVPFDQFTIEQLAGDLLPEATLAQQTATGFHRQTLTNKEGGVDQEEYRCKATVDRASTTGTVWLGLTVGCAECHSHKYDPISQREFYQLYAFFNSASEKDIPNPTPEETATHTKLKQQWQTENDTLQAALKTYLKDEFPARQTAWELAQREHREPEGAKSGKPVTIPDDLLTELVLPASQRPLERQAALTKFFREQIDERARELDKAIAQHARKEPKAPDNVVAALVASDTPRQTRIHLRGDFLRPGDEVRAGTPAILHTFQARGHTADRLDLARWLFEPANPLTARVAVNRVWQHLFGRALVTTVNDFGTRGERPSHPELLDWLATEYPRLGWSQKQLIRLIVTSATYRQSSRLRPGLSERDPNNSLLARQSRFRLEAETVRDAHLTASGLLTRRIGGASIRPPLPADIAALGYASLIKWKESEGTEKYRRGLYILYQRTVPYPMLATFDAPDSNTACTRRERSNTPLQALTLLNDPVFFECARALGERMARLSGGVDERIKRLFVTCLGRTPAPVELARVRQFHAWQTTRFTADPAAASKVAGGEDVAVDTATWTMAARAVMNLDEFLTRE